MTLGPSSLLELPGLAVSEVEPAQRPREWCFWSPGGAELPVVPLSLFSLWMGAIPLLPGKDYDAGDSARAGLCVAAVGAVPPGVLRVARPPSSQVAASCILQLVKHIQKLQAKDVPVAEEVSALFAGELNPVAPKAQKKVPVPEGLDLDAWINEPLSDSESEDERPRAVFHEEEQRRPKHRPSEADEEELARRPLPPPSFPGSLRGS
ncbi:hypothetical protein P7K49_032839 [Saguinus oedipus]|uniref:Uncharacterized protein n=1 Tax=Saguinus oedipus TaxID=9490 RepID=A0ABQ9TRX5_SAGOE|nr:hypothetical protein P7K49_032839 [Saguinus oedipus]